MSWPETLLGRTRGQVLARLRRADESINDLAAALGISDNGVRAHVAALERDGLVEPAGLVRGTGGKPAQLYRISAAGERLFPKAYALMLAELLRVLEAREGYEAVLDILRAVGSGAARAHPRPGPDPESRVRAAADVLRALGGDVDVERAESGWLIRGYACPLSALVVDHPQVCALAETLVEELTSLPVSERCDRGERPRCAFLVADP